MISGQTSFPFKAAFPKDVANQAKVISLISIATARKHFHQSTETTVYVFLLVCLKELGLVGVNKTVNEAKFEVAPILHMERRNCFLFSI